MEDYQHNKRRIEGINDIIKQMEVLKRRVIDIITLERLELDEIRFMNSNINQHLNSIKNKVIEDVERQ